MTITKENKIKFQKLMSELDASRNAAVNFLNKSQLRKASLNFNLEARTADKISDLLKVILKD